MADLLWEWADPCGGLPDLRRAHRDLGAPRPWTAQWQRALAVSGPCGGRQRLLRAVRRLQSWLASAAARAEWWFGGARRRWWPGNVCARARGRQCAVRGKVASRQRQYAEDGALLLCVARLNTTYVKGTTWARPGLQPGPRSAPVHHGGARRVCDVVAQGRRGGDRWWALTIDCAK
nr:uncharacterized protein LOC117841059 [Setaria viridis]